MYGNESLAHLRGFAAIDGDSDDYPKTLFMPVL